MFKIISGVSQATGSLWDLYQSSKAVSAQRIEPWKIGHSAGGRGWTKTEDTFLDRGRSDTHSREMDVFSGCLLSWRKTGRGSQVEQCKCIGHWHSEVDLLGGL